MTRHNCLATLERLARRLGVALACLGLVWGAGAHAQAGPGADAASSPPAAAVVSASTEVPVPSWTGPVMDLTSTLSPAQSRELTDKLRALEQSTGAQLYVLVVPTTGSDTIEQYARRVFDQWQIGRRGVDDGILLLVAKDDHSLRIDTGYGLEGAVTDLQAGRIIREQITPYFTFGDFYAGINAGVDALIALMHDEPLPAPVTEDDEPVFMLAPLSFLALVVPPIMGAFLLGAFVYVLFESLWLALVAAAVGFGLSLLGRSMGLSRRLNRHRRNRWPDDRGGGGFGGGFGGGGPGGGGGGRGGGGGASGSW